MGNKSPKIGYNYSYPTSKCPQPVGDRPQVPAYSAISALLLDTVQRWLQEQHPTGAYFCIPLFRFCNEGSTLTSSDKTKKPEVGLQGIRATTSADGGVCVRDGKACRLPEQPRKTTCCSKTPYIFVYNDDMHLLNPTP